ncbi:MAG: methylenetetrahydrofolate reductase [NAD(P)H] [Planctomycetota bacterium]
MTKHIADVFKEHRTTLSFEFFPPKSAEAAESLYKAISQLEPLKPTFVSVTYGAGGTTRELTHDLVMRIHRETSLDPIPHLTSVCHTEREITEVLTKYAQAGIGNILALGGDAPRDMPNYRRQQDAFQHAADLVRFIREFKGHPDPRGFGIGVAGFPEGHPATPNRLTEMELLKKKVDEGADYICTQLFFDNRDFYDFRDRCQLAGIHVPIIAGIMPITSTNGMARMAELAAGSRFPAPLLRALQRCEDERQAIRNVGVHWATEQCRDLIDNEVAGIHFYTLNRSAATKQIYQFLGLRDSTSIA